MWEWAGLPAVTRGPIVFPQPVVGAVTLIECLAPHVVLGKGSYGGGTAVDYSTDVSGPHFPLGLQPCGTRRNSEEPHSGGHHTISDA